MIAQADLHTIIEQYSNHGWSLRRALLSAESVEGLASLLASELAEVLILDSPTEALWFSRRSLPDREAWELRRLSGSPFALVAVLEDSFSEDEREEVLRDTERRMFDGTHLEPTSH